MSPFSDAKRVVYDDGMRFALRFRRLILPVAVVAVGVACRDESEDGDPQCTPPTAVSLTVLVQGTNAEAFAGRPAAMRVLAGGSMVMSCSTGSIAVGGTIELAGAAAGPVGVDGDLTGGACDVARTWSIVVDAEATPPSGVTWGPGLGCPGE